MRFLFTAPQAQCTIKNNAGDVIYQTRADNYVFEADASGILTAVHEFALLLKSCDRAVRDANRAYHTDLTP